MKQLTLPSCVIPGCTTPVGETGDVCQGCRAAFGTMLRHDPDGERLTEEQIIERDEGVAALYAAMWRRK